MWSQLHLLLPSTILPLPKGKKLGKNLGVVGVWKDWRKAPGWQTVLHLRRGRKQHVDGEAPPNRDLGSGRDAVISCRPSDDKLQRTFSCSECWVIVQSGVSDVQTILSAMRICLYVRLDWT